MEKINGILMVNAFLDSPQTNEIYRWLMESAKRNNINMFLKNTGEYMADLIDGKVIPNVPEADFVLFWNKDVALGEAMEENGLRLFNRAEAIKLCDNKAFTHKALSGIVDMPKTIKVPMTFKGINYTNYDFLSTLEDYLGYPFVIKECWGSYGGQVYLAHNKEEAISIFDSVEGTECIAQEFVSKHSGRDLRVYVVGDEVVAAMERRNPNDFRANITNGGQSLPYKITDEQAQMAIAATKALGLDFGGVDLLFLENDKPILCEVNSNAQFKGLYNATGINIADSIFQYIKKKI